MNIEYKYNLKNKATDINFKCMYYIEWFNAALLSSTN